MRNEHEEVFDKKQIALAIRNSTLDDDLKCSLLEDRLIKNCESCNLNNICTSIDEIREKYIRDTTKIVSSFIL